ncbi:MAG: sugar-binding protein [candidate division FCPU426 bacterium]
MRILKTLLLALLAFTACGKKPALKTLVMVPKGVHPYYAPCFEGFKDAAAKYGAKAEYIAPSDFELPKQVRVLEDVVARQVDGIALSALDDGGLVPVVHDAVKAGIKVLTFDAPAPSTEALSYIGTANEAAGFAAGQALIKVMNGKGQVAVLQGGLAAPNLNQRYAGFERALKAAPGMKIVAREDTGGKLETTVNKAETLLQSRPGLSAFFGVSAEAVPGAAAVVTERKLVGKIVVAGFDDLPDTLGYVRSGTVAFCLAQKTYLMGWLAAVKLLDAIHGKAIEKVIDTGVVIVAKDNVDSYQADMRKAVAALGTTP